MERVDVTRNRQALVSAAREAFFTRGLDTPMKSIARAAGLGSATLYRHFPTRADLIAAVFGDEIATCRLKLMEVGAIADPWVALRHLLESVADAELSMPDLATTLSSADASITGYAAMWTEAEKAIELLVQRLQADGGARGDLVFKDLLLVVATVRSATIVGRESARRDTPRLLEFMIDGLRRR